MNAILANQDGMAVANEFISLFDTIRIVMNDAEKDEFFVQKMTLRSIVCIR